eukprot:240110_1
MRCREYGFIVSERKIVSIGFAGICVFILWMFILVLKSPYSRKCCHCIMMVVLLLLIQTFLNHKLLVANINDAEYNIDNPPVTIYAGAWIEIGGLTDVHGQSACLLLLEWRPAGYHGR